MSMKSKKRPYLTADQHKYYGAYLWYTQNKVLHDLWIEIGNKSPRPEKVISRIHRAANAISELRCVLEDLLFADAEYFSNLGIRDLDVYYGGEGGKKLTGALPVREPPDRHPDV